MNMEIKIMHFELDEAQREYIEKKIQKIDYAKDLIVDLLITLAKEKRLFKIDININFKWNYSTHIKNQNYDIIKGIDDIIDKLERKIRREKEKIKSHT